jgi:hypothetical protein
MPTYYLSARVEKRLRTTYGSLSLATEPRTAFGRQLAEAALVRLAVNLGPHTDEVVVIGGLAPELLTQSSHVPHQGTNDVDILLPVGFVYDRDDDDFSWLEQALVAGGFELDQRTRSGWRWTIALRGLVVRLELLCDVHGDEGNYPIALPGCEYASAMNLQGPRAALRDSEPRTIVVPEELGGGAVEVRFAGLGGYLLAKAAALAHRGRRKDCYDFAFVLLHNDEGGPSGAARAIRTGSAGELVASYERELRGAVDQFTTGIRPAATVYAEEMQIAGEETEFDVLVEDAASAAEEFWRALSGDSDASAERRE